MNDTCMRAAIVGCGAIAPNHANALKEISGVKLVACADIRPERTQAFAEKYDAKPYNSLEDMLNAEQIDVLHICTPHYLHAPMIEQALARGLYVFTEKPPIIFPEQLERLRSLPGIERVGVCFQNRWNPATLRVKELLASGELGAAKGIRAFVTWTRGAEYYTESGWRGQIATEGGGVLVNQSIHTLDLMLQFMGNPTDSRAIKSTFHLENIIEVEDTIAARIKFGDKVGVFYATTGYVVDAPVMIEITCETGAIRIDGTDVGVLKGDKWVFEQMEVQATGEKGYWGNGHLRCIEDYYRCVRTGDAFDSSFTAVIPTAECMLALLK